MLYEIRFTDNKIYTNNTENESITDALEGITIEQVKTINEIQETSCTCQKCKGTGKLDQYVYWHNGNCFKCDGTGLAKKVTKKKLTKIKQYFDYSWMV